MNQLIDFYTIFGLFKLNIEIDFNDSFQYARVARVDRNSLKIYISKEKIETIYMNHTYEFCTGDWIKVTKDENRFIELVKPINEIKRYSGDQYQNIARNIDYGIVVSSLNSEMKENKIQRFILLLKECRINPIIIFTKKDLFKGDLDKCFSNLQKTYKNIPCFFVSKNDESSIGEIKSYFSKADTAIMLGSSGVGKSTLINLIMKNEIIRTQEISEIKDRGKHTTTAREMYLIENDFLLIDSPGIRSLSLGEVNEGFKDEYADIMFLMSKCQFYNCRHETERNCAVKAALENEEIEYSRYKSFLKLSRESEMANIRKNKELFSEIQKTWKKRSINARKAQKTREKFGF